LTTADHLKPYFRYRGQRCAGKDGASEPAARPGCNGPGLYATKSG